MRNDSLRRAHETRESGNADGAFGQAQFSNPLDSVLAPAVAPVAHVGHPFLRLLPPVCPVEYIGSDLPFARKNREHFSGKTADGCEIARVALQLLPSAGVRRQQQTVDAALGHFAAHVLVTAVAFFDG